MLSVGLLGATGYVGSSICAGLVDSARKGLLKFVILHSPTSDVSKYPEDVEKRSIDLEKGDQADHARAIDGLNIVVSAISGFALPLQKKMFPALKASSSLITFFPSDYATPFSADILSSPIMRAANVKGEIVDECLAMGIPYTVCKVATTEHLLFEMPSFSSFKLKENKVELYYPLGNGKRGLTSKAFTEVAFSHLILDRTAELPNKTFSIVEISFSAKEAMDIMTDLNGSPPAIDVYTEEDYQRDVHPISSSGFSRAGFGKVMRAARLKGMSEGTNWPGIIIDDSLKGWQKKGLEEYMKAAI